ncbi:MAG: hypothetical protein M3N43_13560, partial [Actinomycetota bacterium]|nr:hypothetical protein [Actinomycetota bacterium]
MPTVSFLSWNIENFGLKKDSQEFHEYLTQVICSFEVDFLAILEVRANNALELGHEIAGRVPMDTGEDKLWVFQESDWVTEHTEQVLTLWNPNKLKWTGVIDLSNINFPKKDSRPPFAARVSTQMKFGTKLVGMPVVAYHAQAPKKQDTAPGCAALAKIPGLKEAGVVMGDFNIDSSDVTQGLGKEAFGALAKLGYAIGLKNSPTSLKTVKRVEKEAKESQKDPKLADCVSSEYDNAFTRLPSGIKVAVERADLITLGTASSMDDKYKELFSAWYAAHKKGVSAGWKATDEFPTVLESFRAYRQTVSDHLPVKVT